MGEDYNNAGALWALGSARFLAREDLEINLNGNWFRNDSRGSGGRCTYVQEPPDPSVAALLAHAILGLILTEVHFLAPEVKEAYQRPYDVFGAHLSYDFADDRAQVALWARNLTDTEYFGKVQSLVPIFGMLSRHYQAPRTFGAEITCQF